MGKSKDGAKKMAQKLAAKLPDVIKSEDKGGYTVNTFSDGTYGYMMPDGSFKNGYKSKDGAGKAGKKLAEKAAKSQEDAQAELLEKQAQELQEKLQRVYSKAVEGMNARIDASLRQFEKDRAKWEADVAAGKKDAKAYEAWLKDQALHNDQLKALKRALTQDLTAADKMAMAYVNDMPASVYAEGMNFATYEIEHGAKTDTSFTLYDKNTVMELVANEPDLLPQAAFDKAKDLAWNSRHVTSAVTQAVLQGQTIPQLAASLAGIAAMDQRAAMRSARTAMTSAHSLGKLKGYERAAGMGIDVEKQWLAALDQRTRGSHRHLDGETVKLDEEFSNGLKYPGDPDGPGSEVYNCFLGDVNVDSDSEIVRSYKSLYVGETITIDTASGVHFTCTPNHPILTDRGWVPAHLLNDGDNLLVTFRTGESSGPDPDVQHGFASFEAVHELLREFGYERASALGVNFHGDRPTSDVEIVGKEGLLRVCGDATGVEESDELLLELSDPSTSAGGSVREFCSGRTTPRPSDMGRVRDALLLVLGHRGHADAHRLRSVSRSNATIAENAIDNLPAETMCRRELIDGLSGKVALDKVINVEVGSTRGSHVYNLQTGDGYYFVNSIIPGMCSGIFAIAKNCRCTLVPVIGDVEYDEVVRHSNLGGVSYEEWREGRRRSQHAQQGTTHRVVDGSDIVGTWKRRRGDFEFEIEDVLDAQGFDGNPRIVDADEFDEVVKQANGGKGFIAQRSYTGTSKEVADEYRRMLYDGKWYVDCSTGGAQYGQGMYCAADYTGKLTDGIRAEMEHYTALGKERNKGVGSNAVTYVETMTLDPSAKVITYDDLMDYVYKDRIEKRLFREATEGMKFSEKELAVLHESILQDATPEQLDIADNFFVEDRSGYYATKKKIQAIVDGIKDKANSEFSAVEGMDPGAIAALHGYDAINAEGHGDSGSYTVVLNRTKLIIKRPEGWK